jgi:parallel beta-helix repeat protein
VLGNDVTVLRCVAEDNGSAGLGGSGFSDVLVQDTISRRNNQKFLGGTEGGGGKWTRADGLLIERYNGYDNDGPGIWLDIENINVTIRDSALHHNYSVYRNDGSSKIDGIGMFLEISGVVADDHGKVVAEGPILAEGNRIYDNERQGVLIYATRNVTLRNNVFANNDVMFKDQRPTPYENRGDRIVSNQFQNARITGDDYTAAGGWRKKNFDFDANVFDNLDGRIYRWGNDSFNSLSQLRAQLGFELTGRRGTVTFDPVVTDDDPGTSGAA